MTNDTNSSDRRRSGTDLLTPGEVADMFGVDPRTVTRWANSGKLHPLRTPGGHRRYRASEVYDLIEEGMRDG